MIISFKNMIASKNNLLKASCFTALMLGGALQAMDVQDLNQQLFNAAEVGHLDHVTQLLGQGADVNAKDQGSGWTALMVAAKNNHFEVCKLLIEKGANVNAKDQYHLTALMAAENYEICELLIDNGANVNAKNNLDSTILITAAMLGNIEKCKLLVKKGADVVAIDQWHVTALKAIAATRLDQDFDQRFDPSQVKELCELIIDALLKVPMNQTLLKSIHLTPQQRSEINALVASFKHTPIKGLSHDTRRLIIEDVRNSFKRRNFIEEQIVTAKDPLRQELLDYLKRRIELQIQEGPQMKMYKG